MDLDSLTLVLDVAAASSVALACWFSLKKRDLYANLVLLAAAILYLFITIRSRLYATAMLCGLFLLGAISGALNIRLSGEEDE